MKNTIKIKTKNIDRIWWYDCWYTYDMLTHYFGMKISSKRELKQIAISHSSDIDFQDFMNLCKKCTEKPYSFLVIDTTLASDNSSCFRENLLERI